MYADYNFYKSTYFGNKISAEEFNSVMSRASIILDNITLERAAKLDPSDPLYKSVQLAACAVADVLKDYETEGDGIRSESVGSYSISYADNSSKTLSVTDKIWQVVKMYLGNSGLMYRGLDENE